jgi:hypothetical protein
MNPIEQALLPLFECLSVPDKIEFDDDILLTLTSFMKKKKSISLATI